MSLKPCPECTKPVSSEASRCPQCGYPVNSSRRALRILLVVVVTVASAFATMLLFRT